VRTRAGALAFFDGGSRKALQNRRARGGLAAGKPSGTVFMDTHSAFYQAFIYLLAATLLVPVARKLGLGSVLGYFLGGVLIGPFVFRLIEPSGDVMHFAEYGVVMMLFVVGLELRPALLWQMRGPILGLGSIQVSATAVIIAGAALAVGVEGKAAIAIGLIGAMSSTAIVLQLLQEKGLAKTPGGEASFAVLLFQDISVIPILALMPLLATEPGAAAAKTHGMVAGPAWVRALITIATIAAIVAAGRFLMRHFFRFVATARLNELFTAATLLLVVGIVLVTDMAGLSPALGAFISGVVLAESEYRHQLEADIEPFKGLLLGLFFISVGASLDFVYIGRQPLMIAGLAATLILIKVAVLLPLARLWKIGGGDRSLFAVALAQGGEFAFVLFSVAEQQRVLAPAIIAPLIAAVALSMAATPVLLLLHEKLLMPQLARGGLRRRAADVITEPGGDVLLAGFGRFGHIVGRLLRAHGFRVTVLDNDSDQVETLRKYGLNSFYGDASRADLLRTAGIDKVQLFVLAIDNEEKSLAIIEMLKRNYPALPIFARAASRQHAYELLRRGIDHVYRETLGSALDLGSDVLRALGVQADRAERAVRVFKKYDEESVREMAMLDEDDDTYISRARQHIDNLEALLRADRLEPPPVQTDNGAHDHPTTPPGPATKSVPVE
jgi:glutathione-regulated potassium-efflux system ancillary protein KefC/glutathione-regulated potassium-efflux system protein KefB